MYRDMMKTAEKAKGIFDKSRDLTRYDLSCDEIQQLVDMSGKDIYKALTTAFDLGFVLGTRAHSRQRVPEL